MKFLFKYLVYFSTFQSTKRKKVITKKRKFRKKINSSLGNIGVLFLFLIASPSSLAKEAFQGYTTNSVSGTSSSYTGANDGNTYTFGNGNDLELSTITAGGETYTPKQIADKVLIRRVDNTQVSGERCNIFIERSSTGTGDVNSAPTYPVDNSSNCSIEEILGGLIVNRGALDLFSNDTPSNGEFPNNIERVDFVYTSGITAPTTAVDLDRAGHTVMEKNGNNPVKVAAITAVDASGNPTAFGSPVTVNTSDYGKSGTNFNNNFLIDASTSGGVSNPEYDLNKNEQLGGVIVTLSDFGIAAGQTYYGFAMFGTDVDPSSPGVDLLDPTTFPSNTPDGGGQTGGADWQGGMAGYWTAFSVQDYGDAPDTYGTDATAGNSSNSSDPVGASHTIVNGIHLGTAPDAETDAPTPLDGSGDGAEDDGIALLPLTTGSTGYAVPPADITATGTGTLHAWVDFDKNGTFAPTEYTSVAINSGTPDPSGLSWSGITVGSAGNTYARFRFTSDTSINANTPGGAASDGEVEDYQVTITSASPNQTIDDTPSATSCPVQGGALIGPNIFTPYDNGTFGFEDGSATQSPATNPYTGITNGDYAQYKPRPTNNASTTPVFGEYSFVANIVVARNRFQHEPVTDPVYGVTGRFFATDPDIDSIPELGKTLNGLTPNQFYEISFWAANSEPNGTPNTIDIFIDGQSVYTTGELPAIPAALAWKKHTFTFTNGSKTSVDLRIKSTEAGTGGLDFYLDNIEMRECSFAIDYGDAPNSYGDALHTTIPPAPQLYLGSVAPDSENLTLDGGDAGVGADGDDASSNDDEDAFTTLPPIPTSGAYDLNNIPVTNTSGVDATLHAWVDFDGDGKFTTGEYQSTTVSNGATAVNLSWTVPGSVTTSDTYARFRLTSNPLSDDVGTTDVDERSKDAVIAGEVEDYLVQIIASDPNVLLVKRITAINSNTTSKGGDDLAIYNQDSSNPYDDNKLDIPEPDPIDTDKWFDTTSDTSSNFLIGGINGGKVEPDDEIEYTIYFLSTGEAEAKSVLVCDRIPENVTFLPGTFNSVTPATGGVTGSSRGILWLKDGNTESLTNSQDGDAAQYFPPGVDPTTVYPTANCGGTNTNGAVVVNLGDLPNATAPGTPNTSYGYIRFRGKVK